MARNAKRINGGGVESHPHEVTMTTTLTALEYTAAVARDFAITTAEGAHMRALSTLVAQAIGGGVDDDSVLVQDPRHTGDRATPVDAAADEGARRGFDKGEEVARSALGNRVSDCIYLSEEGGTTTQVLRDMTLVVASDPQDGTTTSLNVLFGYCSVATVDLYIHGRFIHLAGAIVGSGSFDVSWVKTTRPGSLNPRGDVYLRAPRLDPYWHRIPGLREDRSPHTLAAVATDKDRWQAVAQFADRAMAHEGEGGATTWPAIPSRQRFLEGRSRRSWNHMRPRFMIQLSSFPTRCLAAPC